MSLLRSISENSALETQNADRYLVLAVEAQTSGNKKQLGQYTKKALHFAKADPAVLDRVERTFAPKSVAKASTIESASPEQRAPEPPSTLLPEQTMTGLERAERAFEAGDTELVERLANEIITVGENEEEVLVAQYLIKRLNAPVDPNKIAVILPFTDKYEAVGAQFRQAIEFGYLGDDEPTRKLVFVDSGATPESVIEAVEKAALEHGVIAAIGPLLSEQTDAAVRTANALRMPLISLSQALDDTAEADWSFQAMLNTRVQVDALLDYVSGELEMKNFAVFAPDNAYGHRAATVFTEAVNEREGQVTVEHFYEATATDLIPFAKEFGRKDYEERAQEYRELRELAEDNGRDPNKVVLPPTIDFDAIFIPDNVSRIPLACAALAYEEFPMGEFQTSKDGPIIPLLGLSGWNHPAMVARGGPYARGSYFTDVYQVPVPPTDEEALTAQEPEKDPADIEQPMTQEERLDQFVADYKDRTGRSPKSLEVVTVDAGRLVAAAAASEAKTRAEFREALLNVTLEESLTGAVGFNEDTRVATRVVQILTITKDGILPARLVDEAKTESP